MGDTEFLWEVKLWQRRKFCGVSRYSGESGPDMFDSGPDTIVENGAGDKVVQEYHLVMSTKPRGLAGESVVLKLTFY